MGRAEEGQFTGLGNFQGKLHWREINLRTNSGGCYLLNFSNFRIIPKKLRFKKQCSKNSASKTAFKKTSASKKKTSAFIDIVIEVLLLSINLLFIF